MKTKMVALFKDYHYAVAMIATVAMSIVITVLFGDFLFHAIGFEPALPIF